MIAQMQHVNDVEDGIDVSEYSQKDKDELREKNKAIWWKK